MCVESNNCLSLRPNEKPKTIRIMEKDFLVRFDFAIKKLLRNKANFAILEGFIEVFLGKKCKIQEILESEGNQDFSDDKFNRVDIKAKDLSGEIFIVEVQTTRYTYYLERILYGVSKAITEQIGNGKRYGLIKQVFSISVVYYDLGVGDDYFYECRSEFYGVHTHNVLKLNQREKISTEELREGDTRKFKYVPRTAADIFPRYYLIRINSFRKVVADAMDEWMDFLKNNSIKDDTTVPGLKEANEQLQYAKMTPEERNSYDKHLEAIEFETDAISTAKTEGIAEGAKSQAIATARQMKADGLPIATIAKYTNLTPDEIDKL